MERRMEHQIRDEQKTEHAPRYDIIVIDDNYEQANIIKLLVEEYGFRARFVTDSHKAFEVVKTEKPRLIILDLMMPEIDGLRLCKMIKEHPETANTRIIIYSGKMYESDRRKALALGADLFLTKPTRSYILLDAIKNLLLPTTDELISN